MDYCSSCHRTLNGALVCPGCGAYAPDIAPSAHAPQNAAMTTRPARWDRRHAEEYPRSGFFDAPDRHDAAQAPTPAMGTAHLRAALMATTPLGSAPSGSAGHGYGYAGHGYQDATADMPKTRDAEQPDGAGYAAPGATRGGGRAARRRQLARWKKNKRRAAIASAVALVGGGLTLALMPGSRPSDGQGHTAAMPESASDATTQTDSLGPSSAQAAAEALLQPGTGKHRRATDSPTKNETFSADTARTKDRQGSAGESASTPVTHVTAKDTSGRSGIQNTVTTSKTASSPSPSTSTSSSASTSPASGSTSSSRSSTGSTSGSGSTSSSDSSTASTTTGTSSPVHLCLLVLCVG